jgi:hypothetical protein
MDCIGLRLVVGCRQGSFQAAEGSLYCPHPPFRCLTCRENLFVKNLQLRKFPWVRGKPVPLLFRGQNAIIQSIGETRKCRVSKNTKTRQSIIQEHAVQLFSHVRVVPGSRCVQDCMYDSAVRCKCEDIATEMQTHPSIIICIL